MGLDVGDVKVGVAVSDPFGWTAQGICTVIRKEDSNSDIEELKEVINKYDVGKIIVGLPRNMNYSIGPQGEKVLAYGGRLEKKLKLPVEFIDERLTTVAANRTLIEADVSRAKRKSVVDKVAAVYILQTYLDSVGK